MEVVVEDGKASLWVEQSFVFLKALNPWPCHLVVYPSAFPTQQPVPGGQDGAFAHPWATPDPGLGTQKALRSICWLENERRLCGRNDLLWADGRALTRQLRTSFVLPFL